MRDDKRTVEQQALDVVGKIHRIRREAIEQRKEAERREDAKKAAAELLAREMGTHLDALGLGALGFVVLVDHRATPNRMVYLAMKHHGATWRHGEAIVVDPLDDIPEFRADWNDQGTEWWLTHDGDRVSVSVAVQLILDSIEARLP